MRITRWDQEIGTEDTNQVLLLLAQWHISQLSQAACIKYAGLVHAVKRGDVKEICLYDLGLPCGDPADYYHVAHVCSLFSKRVDLDLGVDRKDVAWKAFVQAEAKCRESNELFRKYAQGGFFFLPRVESVLHSAQRKIARILGDVPKLSALRLRFGPGATTQVKKKDASPRRKLAQKFCCSEELYGSLLGVLEEMPLWSFGQECPNQERSIPATVLVHLGVVRFVPKNAKTDRTINVEPSLNQMVQLGIGDYIGDQLRREGVDISDQTVNQRLALEGSLTGDLATLDLKMASALISKGIVESLLPVDWWIFLRSIRTGTCQTPDGVIRLEQFSSMGNGFTFPLQTLIFYALAKATAEHEGSIGRVNAFGDDIVIPTSAVPLCLEVLTACGFLVNKEKSFWSGPFRESCGKDYLSGIDVRPSFVKGPLSGAKLFVLHNSYVRRGFPEPASILCRILDESLRIYGPDGFGDGHLIGDWYPRPLGRERGWGGATFETFTYKKRQAFYSLGADYVFPTYSIYTRESVKGDTIDKAASAALKKVMRRSFGEFRPDRGDSQYSTYAGKTRLADTLPGTDGYKRVKIYVLTATG